MAKKGPLKKVIREFVVERKRYLAMPAYDRYEVLECGHVIRQPKDFYGEYYAERRRCTQCAAQQSVQRIGGSLCACGVDSDPVKYGQTHLHDCPANR